MPLSPTNCSACRNGARLLFPFSMAFQPIVNTDTGGVIAYEALVRGPNGEPPESILSQLNPENQYAFDQQCRVKAITLASRLGLAETTAKLSINFSPNAIYSPLACLQLTLKTARELSFPTDRLIFEFTEQEKVEDVEHLRRIFIEYKRQNFKIAMDDFGSGFSGLQFLSEITPDIIKLDMSLIRHLDRRPSAMEIIRHMVSLAGRLGCELIAEGIETLSEYRALRECGVHIMQGFLFAPPAFEALPDVNLPPVHFGSVILPSTAILM